MKNIILITTASLIIFIQGCKVPLPVKNPVTREALKEANKWIVVGSVRVEVFSNMTMNPIPYDKLISEAQKVHGDKIDVIEIKEEKFKLDALTKASMIKEKKGVFSYKYIYNALVVKYE